MKNVLILMAFIAFMVAGCNQIAVQDQAEQAKQIEVLEEEARQIDMLETEIEDAAKELDELLNEL